MLNDNFGAHVTAVAYLYDLYTWKEATPRIFEAVEHITQFRQFMFLVDDGKLELGPPLVKASSDAKDFPGDGNVFSDEVLQREAKRAARRSLVERVLPAVHQRTYEGIGNGSGLFGTPTASLIPLTPAVIYKVRLFKKKRDGDGAWIEQNNYMKTTSRESILQELAKVVPTTFPGVDGPREKQVKEQMEKYVDHKYVPDKYAISNTGRSGLIKSTRTTQAYLFGSPPKLSKPASADESSSSSSAPQAVRALEEANTVRWVMSEHGPKLREICDRDHKGVFPKNTQRNA